MKNGLKDIEGMIINKNPIESGDLHFGPHCSITNENEPCDLAQQILQTKEGKVFVCTQNDFIRRSN